MTSLRFHCTGRGRELEATGERDKLVAMKETLRAPALFAGFGLLAALALRSGWTPGTAAFGLFLLAGAVVVWGTAERPGGPVSPPAAVALAAALVLPAAAWALDRPLAPTALLLALVLFLGRLPALPLPGRPAWTLLADLASGFLLGVLASGRPGDLPATLGAGHLALAYAGLLLFAPGLRPLLGHAAWLAFHLLGVGMVGMKFYPLLAFLPFFLGSGTALYFALTGGEPDRRSRNAYAGILLLLGAALLVERLLGA